MNEQQTKSVLLALAVAGLILNGPGWLVNKPAPSNYDAPWIYPALLHGTAYH